MKRERRILIEGMLLCIVGAAAVAEGIRIWGEMDPKRVSDVLGAGPFIIFLGLCLMLVGVMHFATNYKRTHEVEKVAGKKEMRAKMIGMAVVLASYTWLITIFGYTISTIIFFLLEFRLAGVRSWPRNIILTIAVTVIYRFVFVDYCNMIFPRGIFFR